MSETFNLKRREDRWLMPHEASALRAEIERLRAALLKAERWINPDTDPIEPVMAGEMARWLREQLAVEQAASEKP